VTILGLLILFVVVGVVLWLINTYIPMAPPIKNLMNIAVVIILIVYLISALGLLGPLNTPVRPLR
jgi:hypothetical protein